MDEAIGTIFLFAMAGIIFGDEIGRKIAIWMLIGALVFAFIISPAFALALALAPFAIILMGIGSLISFIKNL